MLMSNSQILEREEAGPEPGHPKGLICQGDPGLSARCSAFCVHGGSDSQCPAVEASQHLSQRTEWSWQGHRAGEW